MTKAFWIVLAVLVTLLVSILLAWLTSPLPVPPMRPSRRDDERDDGHGGKKIDPSRFPTMRFSQEAYNELPRGVDFPPGYLETVDIGFLFKTTGDEMIIGQVVKGEDLIAEQWGAGLSVPKRGINRYRAVIV